MQNFCGKLRPLIKPDGKPMAAGRRSTKAPFQSALLTFLAFRGIHAACVDQWGQCGGDGWLGPTDCCDGTCEAYNASLMWCTPFSCRPPWSPPPTPPPPVPPPPVQPPSPPSPPGAPPVPPVATFGDRAELLAALNEYHASSASAEAAYGPIGSWDVSRVTTMSGLFYEKKSFNGDINGWDVSNVKNMYRMFRRAEEFNQAVNSWNVSRVTNMNEMFYRAYRFDQAVNSWSVSRVTNMKETHIMFIRCI